jgi:hypothetical protein
MPLSLQDDSNLYTNLTTYMVAACGNIPVVTPGHPEKSALIMVLQAGCGTGTTAVPRMPLDCMADGCEPDNYVAAISQWIANGACPN